MIAKVKGNKIEIKDPVTLVQGTVGQTLGVELPADWEGLSVTAVFSAGAVQRDVPVLDDEITIPWEALTDPHAPLTLCFYAAAANGQRVITTANCDPIRIAPSTAPSGQEPEAPSPTRADQIQVLAQQAMAAAQSVCTQAAQGAFNGRDGVDGTDGVSPAVSVSEIQGGHRVQITDAVGTSSFDILDGAPGEVTEAALEAALAAKADIDGNCDDLTAGNARQLAATVGVEDRAPYTFRTSGGAVDIGDRETDRIVGGTIVWNMLLNPASGGQWTKYGITCRNNNDGTWRMTGTKAAHSGDANFYCNIKTVALVAGHKYLFSSNSPYFCLYGYGAKVSAKKKASILHVTSSGTESFTLVPYCTIPDGTEIDELVIPQLFDLTKMFGSAIADYLYQLEQNSAGAGVAWFRKLFPKEHYAHNAGELMSVMTSEHRLVGFNAFDPSTGKAKLVGGNQYQITGLYTALSYADVSGNVETVTPDSRGLFVPAASGTLTVTGGDADTTCVHLVWSGYRNGEFKPYVCRRYALDGSLSLHGIPKLDANNNLYYDGDSYDSDGTVTRRYEKRSYQSGDENLSDAVTDGVSTVVKLASAVAGTAAPYTALQTVDDFGTEEYVDSRDVAIPVGHETFYAANLRDKLQNAPDSPAADGDYIMRRSGAENCYVPLEEVRELPEAPSADGTYTLRVTVSEGAAVYSWTSA